MGADAHNNDNWRSFVLNMLTGAFGLPAPVRALIVSFCNYLVVGVIAFAVDYGLLWSALGLHLSYQLATVLGFCGGLLTNYMLCVAWVWRGTNATSVRDFALFAVIGMGGLLLTMLLMWLSVSFAHLDPRVAKPLIAAIVLVWNFGLRRLFVFFH